MCIIIIVRRILKFLFCDIGVFVVPLHFALDLERVLLQDAFCYLLGGVMLVWISVIWVV